MHVKWPPGGLQGLSGFARWMGDGEHGKSQVQDLPDQAVALRHDGYVIQWMRSSIPTNSLATVYALLAECADDKALGPDVDIDDRCL